LGAGVGDGIVASTTSGAINITTGAGGNIVPGVNGIVATATGPTSSDITIATGANIGFGNASMGGLGISASIGNASSTGNISITAGGSIWSNGTAVLAQNAGSGNDSVLLQSGASLISTSGDGIGASATTGGIFIDTTAGGVVSGGINGINASVATGFLGISTDDNITGTAGDGIHAVASSNGFIAINVSGPSITAGNDNIFASSGGGNILVGAANDISTTFYGASNAGIETVNTTGQTNISINGSDMSALGGALYGIKASSTTGQISIRNFANQIGSAGAGNGVNLAGIEVASNGSGTIFVDNEFGSNIYVDAGGFGIHVVNTGSGFVQINNNASDIGGGAYAIYGSSAGTVWVDNFGNLSGTTDAIFAASTGGGNASVGPSTYVNGTITGATNAGIEASTSTGAVLVRSAATMTIPNALYGIEATSTTGGITISNVGQIGSTGAGNGTDIAGISASSSGANAAGIAIDNSGNIYVDHAGLVTPTNAGIYADNSSGTGNVTVVNSGTIDPPSYGIYANGLGNISVTNNGFVTADTGIHASTTGSTTTVTVLNHADVVAIGGVGGNVTTDGGNGIEAYGNASTGLVTVGTALDRVTGNVTGGSASGASGIDARGFGDVSVYTAANSVIKGGSTAGGAWAISARSLGNVASSPGGAVIVDTLGLVTAIPGGRGGIIAASAGLDATDSVTVTTHGQVYSFDGTAIDARAVNGNVTVDTYDTVYGTQGVGTDGGIAALIQTSGTGNVSVTTHGNDVTGGLGTTTPVASDAIVAQTFTGTLTINTQAGGNLTGTDDGIEAMSSTGAISITTANVITGGSSSTGGPTQLAGSVVNGGNGIIATATGAANITILNNFRQTSSVVGNVTTNNWVSPSVTAGNGINATSAGGNVLISGQGRDLAGNGTGGDDGLAGPVTATGGNGIVGATTGNGTVSIRMAGQTAGNVTGNGTVVNNASVAGTVTVNSGNNSIGISASGANGDVSVTLLDSATAQASVTVNPLVVANVTTGVNNTGIQAVASGTGNVTIALGVNDSVVVGGGNSTGILGQAGSGTLTVTTASDANVTSNGGSAIVTSATTGATTINNVSALRGTGGAAGDAVIRVSSAAVGNVSAGIVTINNNAGGTIASVGGLNSDVAIAATTAGTGPIVINNAGRINGSINLSGAASSTFNNTSALSWHTSGTSTFTNGNDVVSNSATGLIATSGATTFAFLGGTDSISNAGTVIVGETTGASTLTVTKSAGTVALNNSGTIIMGSLNGTTTDGQTNDQILDQGAGMAFVSSGSSRLMIDAYLGAGADAQTACGSTPATYAGFADCIAIGASSGTGTRVSINDTNLAGNGGLNLTGTVIVDGTAGSKNDFLLSTLDGNVVNTPQGPAIRKGFVQYQLLFDAPNANWDLVGVPTGEAFELSKFTALGQSLWYETAGGWNERTATLRHDFANGTMATGWSSWVKGYYGHIDRDSQNTLVVLGNPLSYNASYKQNYEGVQFGADYSFGDVNNGAWVFGLLGGYNRSDVDFADSFDGSHLTAYNVGGYASFLMGPFFADLLVKDDITKIDPDLVAFSGLKNINGNSLGGEFTAGARFGGDADIPVVIEPMATLAYVGTHIDSFASQGMNFNWNNGSSFRGTLAVRLSKDFIDGQTTWQPFLLGGFGDEFKGENRLNLTSGGNSLVINDKPVDTFATASLGLNILGSGGLSGFIRADGLFASKYKSGAIRIGVRYLVGE
jgi:hypothetical protein